MIILFGAVLVGFASPAGAAVITSTWVGGNGRDWNVAANWSPPGVPNNGTPGLASQYDVIIDDANEGPYIGGLSILSVTVNSLTINQSSGFVEIRNGGTLELANSGGLNNLGTVTVKGGGLFILNGGSITSHKIKLEGITGTAKRAKLRLNSNTTLNLPSASAEIVGSDPDDTSGLPGGTPGPQTPDGLIDGNGTLTLGSAGRIHGELEIQAGLVNNGLVDADDDEGKIYLSSMSKSGGSGADFKATAGLLEVDVRVSGSADWTAAGPGFLFVTTGGQISGADLNILKVGNNNAGLKVSGPVTLAGNLDVSITDNSRWSWTAPCKFIGGTAQNPVTIELASKDVYCEDEDCPGGECSGGGACNWPETECWDLAWPTVFMGMGDEVIIGPGAHVRGVDNWNNGNRNGPHCFFECFFVFKLKFEDADGRYDRNDRDAHLCNSNAAEGQVEGDPLCP